VLGAYRCEPAHVLQPSRERVALTLELGEAEQARAADLGLGDPPGARRDVRERRGDELRQLALEPRDLPAQRPPRGALVERLARRCCAINRQLLEAAHASDSSCRRRTRRFYQRTGARTRVPRTVARSSTLTRVPAHAACSAA
jgi:hypothetical protein